MNKSYFIHIIRFIFLLLFQGLILDKLSLYGGIMIPFPYIYALLLLPLSTSRWLLLLIGFIYGFALDCFSSTLGMHTSAAVFLAFIIPYLQGMLAPIEGYSITDSPTIKSKGWSWFLIYAGSLTILHHSWLFFIEAFQISNFVTTLLKILFSSVLSLAIMLLFQFFSFNSKKS